MRSSDAAPPGLARSAAAARQAGLGRLRHVARTGSTNADLVAEAHRGRTGPAVLVADHQTAGRGRLQRRWSDAGAQSGRESLLVSVRLAATAAQAHDRVTAVSAASLSAAGQ